MHNNFDTLLAHVDNDECPWVLIFFGALVAFTWTFLSFSVPASQYDSRSALVSFPAVVFVFANASVGDR